MSATADTDRFREAQFALGSFLGMLTIALGFSFWMLAISKGVRRSAGGYLPALLETSLPIPLIGSNVLVFSGVVLMLGGAVGRLYSRKFPADLQSAIRTVGTPVIVVGFAVFSFGLSPQTTVSAPWLSEASIPVTVIPILVGMFLFPAFQLARLRRGSGLLSKTGKKALAGLSLLLLVVGVAPHFVYVGGLLFAGMSGPQAAGILPLPDVVLSGGLQNVLLLVLALEMVFAGYAILRTAANSVGW